GLRHRLESLALEAGEDEAVDLILRPACVLDLRDRWALGLHERPMLRIDRSLGDPPREESDLLPGQLLPRFRGRHDLFPIARGDAPDDFVLVWFSLLDRLFLAYVCQGRFAHVRAMFDLPMFG